MHPSFELMHQREVRVPLVLSSIIQSAREFRSEVRSY